MWPKIFTWITSKTYRTPKSGVTALVVGGAQEALEHDSQNVPIVLRHRKGNNYSLLMVVAKKCIILYFKKF